ncbi:magnesium transporter [Georgenia sp. 311]|uniref:Magnesium transporter n=1 Tax=Georgenia wutianyii TaxID=2585135 RepID=A0ABX5VNM0_9MICO|nr:MULTISPECIES: CBS domain-containing protein [Georgenia]QDB80104.1 magnesium transporter [Georgenia wutianyii]TNC18079.1 magnesium transporter [Georgenia sp. 311]
MSTPVSRSAPSRVFVGRLAGTPVFDPLGDPVGKVHDVVVLLRTKNPPRAVGLVVEVPGKRRVFLPLTRVVGISGGAVITTGLLNIRRFSQRASETLVLGQLVDRRLTLADGSGDVIVSDVAIEQQRNRDWLVTQLFVARTTQTRGLRRRRGEQMVVEVGDLVDLVGGSEPQPATSFLATIEDLKPADVADVMHDLPVDRQLAVAAELTDERLADVLEELSDDDRVAIVSSMDAHRAADVLDVMQPDDAADLVNELPPDVARSLLDLMEPEEAEDVRRLLRYEERTAGGLMTTEPLILPPESTVAVALASARRVDVPPALATMIFVVRPPLETPTGRLVGVVHIQKALRESPAVQLGTILDADIESLGPHDEIGKVTRLLATYNLTALPVVDDERRLLGAVSVDDVLDHLLPEDWRDADTEDTDTAMTRSAHG